MPEEGPSHLVVLHYAIPNGELTLRHELFGADGIGGAVRASLSAMGSEPRKGQLPEGAVLMRLEASVAEEAEGS
jgi:hypothetical protein